MFYEIDLDRSGTLSEQEANGALVKSLRPGSGGKTTVQWDTDDNMKVSLVEWLQGWEQVFESAGEEAANALMERTKKRNAKRVAETGHGHHLHRNHWKPKELRATIESMLMNEAMQKRLTETSTHMRSEHGPTKAAAILDQLLA